MIDPAMCRPGRLDKLLYVDLPSADERAEIVRTLTRIVPLGIPGEEDSVSTLELVRAGVANLVRERCDGYSGADLAAVIREAGVAALKRTLGTLDAVEDSQLQPGEPALRVSLEDFSTSLVKVQPSVSFAQRRKYEALRQKFSGLPVRVGKEENNKKVDGVGG